MKNLLFRRRRPAPPAAVLSQGFDVRVLLRKGDKIVRRNSRGEIEIVCVAAEIALDQNGEIRRSR